MMRYLYFRLKWKANDEMDCYHLLLLLAELVKYSSYLERLVFIRDSELYGDDVGVKPARSLTIQVADIVPFIAAMPNLVALCLAGFQIDPPHVKLFQSRLNEEILQFRPYLWLHVGPQLPLGNDPNFCPRVHYEEIVNPSDSYYAARSATRFWFVTLCCWLILRSFYTSYCLISRRDFSRGIKSNIKSHLIWRIYFFFIFWIKKNKLFFYSNTPVP